MALQSCKAEFPVCYNFLVHHKLDHNFSRKSEFLVCAMIAFAEVLHHSISHTHGLDEGAPSQGIV